jgi:UDP-glucose 4-epimerase
MGRNRVLLPVNHMTNTVKGKHILVTGGAGFMGSNLVIALVSKGAIVTVLDNMSPQQGGNLFNLKPVKSKITMDFSDIRDTLAINQLVQGKDYIFHLARQTDHILSQTDPFPDIDINVRGTAILLEACKKFNPTVRLIYTGTRGQYGPAVKLPVSETAPTNPRGIYEITNLTAEKMVGIYNDIHGVRAVSLRITNVYGPRAQMKSNHYGVVNWFVRLAIDGESIPVYGDGALKRDFLYIDDAIDAMLLCAQTEKCYGEIINVGRDTPETFKELAEVLVATAKSGSWKFTPFSRERKAQEPGDFVSDITKIKKLTGWKPKTPLAVGLKKTIVFYRKNKAQYW